MNYIKQLQKDKRQANDGFRALNDGLNDLVAYLNSPKFSSGDSLDGYVNVKDVILRINEIKSAADYSFIP